MTDTLKACPFSITLDHSEPAEIICRNMLRDLPKKRCVLHGDWGQRPVLVKLFLHPTAAQRHWLREKQGIEKLLQADITTPALLFAGQLTDQTPVLVFEFVPNAQSALQLWSTATSDSERTMLLSRLVTEIAHLHERGLWQQDLHLGNFLVDDTKIYTIDGDAISGSTEQAPLDTRRSITNLALFWAQIAPHFDHLQPEIVRQYSKQRQLPEDWVEHIKDHVADQRRKRRLKYVAKAFRSCSEFICCQHARLHIIHRRDAQDSFIASFKDDPDQMVAAGKHLKNGNSATVVRLTTTDGDWAIKRYNIKNILHAVKRCLRPTRASVSWGNAHRLKISGISTPSAIAMAEKRFGPFRFTGYYVCDFVDGQDVADYFVDDNEPSGSQLDTANHLIELFRIFLQLGIVHGDCKATNFLVTDHGVSVIDLDAMWEPKSRNRFNKLYSRDRSRFLRNWKTDCALYRWFDRHLPQPDDI